MRHLYSPRNPFRQPHWRWQRVQDVLDGVGPCITRRDDKWVRAGYHFRRALSAAETPAALSVVCYEFEALYYAHDIWRAGEDDDALAEPGYDERRAALRWEIEARTLARETPEAIGEKTGVAVDILTAFLHVFFDVADRLGQPSYVLHQLIGPRLQTGLSVKDYQLLWKLYGYLCGPVMLDGLIDTMFVQRRPQSRDELDAAAKDLAAADHLRQSMLAAKTLANNAYTQSDILDRHVQIQAQERIAVGAGGNSSGAALTTGIGAMLQQFAALVTVGDAKHSLIDVPRLPEYHKAGAELRYEELVAVAAGDTDAPEPDEIAAIKFPAKTSAEPAHAGHE